MGIFDFFTKNPRKMRYQKGNGFLIPTSDQSNIEGRWIESLSPIGFEVLSRSPLTLKLKKGTQIEFTEGLRTVERPVLSDIFFQSYVDNDYTGFEPGQKERFIQKGMISLRYIFATNNDRDKAVIDSLNTKIR